MDWLSPQLLLLVAAPLAMVLAALALAVGQRRAEVRRARESLGKPLRAIPEGAEGQRVLLEGVLDTVDAPCERFEDGAPCAAATVQSDAPHPKAGEGAAAQAEGGAAHSARASVLVLTVGAERVALDGPVDVFVGSRETDPGAPFASLRAAVRARIASAASIGAGASTGSSRAPSNAPAPPTPPLGHAPSNAPALPSPAPHLGHARPRFRSLSTGDRVRAIGTLAKQSEGDRTGYRQRARWTLHGDAGEPLVLAYAGTPRHQGTLGSVLRGVRGVPVVPAAMAVALLAGLVTGAAATAARPPPAPPSPPPINGMASHFADPVRCAALHKEHAAAAGNLTVCKVDSECTSELRGGAYFGLQGCHRFRNRLLSPARADAAEKAWFDEGCAASYEICPAPPPAMCREGRCVERPPAPVPETWHREEVPGGFFLYVPPGVTRTTAPGDDPQDASFKGSGIRIVSDFAGPGAVLSDEAGEGRPVQIGGHPARVWRSGAEITLTFDRGPSCQPPRCSQLTGEDQLTLHADCEGEPACDDAWTALQSVRFW